MSRSVNATVAKLFLNAKPSDRALEFRWLLIRRRNRPFLLLSVAANDTFVGLELYSAQRRRAKIWRAVIPMLLRSPAGIIFQRIRFAADENSEIIRFLAEQSGLPAAQLRTPAIKFGGRRDEKSRLVLLLCDQTNRPIKVIKVGLDEAGRAATEREADLLEKLPPKTLGCIRMTGRLNSPALSAFATAYFSGESPDDDAGLETLFHSWINSGPAVPIESLEAWDELETQVARANPTAWQALRPALAGKSLRSTLHHGDFAPWNIRAVNVQSLEAFDWESGSLLGIPGWDWFHFIVQTSILARRHSVPRVSAEIEELFQSPRFKKYAEATSISPIVKPLMLAYLLRHRWVVNPLEGARQTEELYDLLAAHWGYASQEEAATIDQPVHNAASASAPTGSLSWWADARNQLKAAWVQLANVFWEPTLSANIRPALKVRLKSAWPMALFCTLVLAALGNVQYYYTRHLLMLPLYAIPCLLATWKISRRWGTSFACLGAVVGPLVAAAKEPAFYPLDLVCWNTLMRFLILRMCVFLADRIRGQPDFLRHLTTRTSRPVDFSRNWAVILASSLWFTVIAVGDLYTGPRVIFLPLYLFPAMLITLFLNLGWGALVVLLAAVVASIDEFVSKYNASLVEIFGWNFIMRFLILFLVILLLDRLSQGNVLFAYRKQNGSPKPAAQT